MSYSSYKSKYQNESRKVTPLSQVTGNLQKQIEIQELGHKVDVILQHNQQLKDQNQALKKKLVFLEGSTVSRSSSRVGGNIPQKRQVQLKIIQIQQLKKQNIVEKQLFSVELDNLSSTLNIVTERKNSLQMQKKELQTKVFSITADFELGKVKMQQNHKKQVESQILKKNVQKNQIVNDMKKNFNKQIQKLKNEWQNEKNLINQQRLYAIADVQNKCQRQIMKTKKHLQQTTKQQITQIQNAAIDKCRKQRQKAQEYVQVMLQNHKQHQHYDQQQLRKQILQLRESLDSRQKLIQGILKIPSKPDNDRYYQQAQLLRKRIKQMTQSYFNQGQLLKVKMAIKHQVDVKQVSNAYGDQIDIYQARIKALQLENDRLRHNYEDEIRNKLKSRQKFELQISKLKNVIRKMKIELQSYGKQLRLNIDGIKDQAHSFSMSMMSELSQQKTKKTFFQEQMRKMRQVLDMKQQQVAQITRQSNEKVQYFQERVQQLKKKIQQQKQQLKQKQQRYNYDIQQKDKWAKLQIKKQKAHLSQEIEHHLRQIQQQKQKYNELKNNIHKIKDQKKQLKSQINQLNHQLDLSKAHIQALRLQMQMFAQNVKPDQALKPLKQHYQRIIQDMHKDKDILKEQNSMQAQQMTKLVAKYQDLQRTLQKTLSTMKKHSQLNQKVVQLGMDNNLVKNLAQLFIVNQD